MQWLCRDKAGTLCINGLAGLNTGAGAHFLATNAVCFNSCRNIGTYRHWNSVHNEDILFRGCHTISEFWHTSFLRILLYTVLSVKFHHQNPLAIDSELICRCFVLYSMKSTLWSFLFSKRAHARICFKGAQAWDIRSLGFSWFLHHKVFMGRWFVGKNINLLF